MNERNNSKSPIVFKLSDIHRAYTAKREADSSEISVQAPHRTRFKEKLLKYLPNLRDFKSGRESILVFEKDIGPIPSQNGAISNSKEDILNSAAKVLRNELNDHKVDSTNNMFTDKTIQESVPTPLVKFLSSLLRGHSSSSTPSVLSIAHLIQFNHVKKNEIPHKNPSVF